MKRPLLLLAAAGALLLSGITVYALLPFGSTDTEQVPKQDMPALVISWDDLISQEAEEALDQQIKELEQAIINAQKPLSQSTPSDEGSAALDAMNALPAEGSEGDVGMSTSMQIGTFHTVADLNNEKVRLPGFIVPFNFEEEGMISEFLFVPFVGACIHVPPPPPNQIVYVTSKKPVAFSSLWEPMWIEGTLTTQRHENVLGNTAYTLQLDKLEAYEDE
ncbi:MAG: DUF3299 domain-containing protein [Parvibaculaceae bacterium]|nr:DUF3299 domain-containing protein [Parvibaculaceae bacterium]